MQRFDQGMMSVSDNAATSALVLTQEPGAGSPRIGAAWADPDLNAWLADLSGVGSRWGVTTSIQDIDRLVLWNGQQNAPFLLNDSYFGIPGHTARPRLGGPFRACTEDGDLPDLCLGTACTRCAVDEDCNPGVTDCATQSCPESCDVLDDPWGDLADHFGLPVGSDTVFPPFDLDYGESRYFTTGLNSATPRALGHLLERYHELDYFSAATRGQAQGSVGEPDVLLQSLPCVRTGPAGCELFPVAFSKGGTRGSPFRNSQVANESSIVLYDDEALVLAAMTKDGTSTVDVTRANTLTPLGAALLRRLLPDLYTDADPVKRLEPDELRAGDSFLLEARLSNAGAPRRARRSR